MTSASTQQLRIAFNNANPALQPIRDGRVRVRGVDLDQVPNENIVPIFREMCRNLNYDITEMAVVTYFTMRHYGLPVTALPIFPSANLGMEMQHIYVHKDAGIRTAKDFEGKRVGMRSYAVTPCVAQKGYLREQGVDLEKVRWFCYDDEHVEALNADVSAGIEYRKGADAAAQMLRSGELDAGLTMPVRDDPNVIQFVPDWRERAIDRYKKDGTFGLGHLLIVKNSAIEADRDVLGSIFDAFRESKQLYLQSLGDKAPREPWEDPLPMGIENVRASLELLMSHTVDQRILPRKLPIDEIFPGNFN